MFKWQKEMNAWAEGKRVQIRHFTTGSGKLLLDWHDIEDKHAWIRKETPTIEYRVYELEIGSYYKLRFRDPELTPVVAVYLGGTRLRWMGHGGSVVDTTLDSATLYELKPEDKVI